MTEKDDAQEELKLSRTVLGVYRHYKGALYTAFAVTLDEGTLGTLVHYYSHEKKSRWTRTIQNFYEEVQTPRELAPVKRFTYARKATYAELLRAADLDGL